MFGRGDILLFIFQHYVVQTGFELMIFLFQPPQCWDDMMAITPGF